MKLEFSFGTNIKYKTARSALIAGNGTQAVIYIDNKRHEIDATRPLQEFTLWCGEHILACIDNPDQRIVEALKTTRRFLDGLATLEEVKTARNAAATAATTAAGAYAAATATAYAADAAAAYAAYAAAGAYAAYADADADVIQNIILTKLLLNAL